MLNEREINEARRVAEKMLSKIGEPVINAQNKALNRLQNEGFNLQEQIEYWNALREFKCFL